MMGFAWGMGGFSVPIVGAIADRVGIEPTLIGLAVIPLAAAAVAMWLPARAPSTDGLRAERSGGLRLAWYDRRLDPA